MIDVSKWEKLSDDDKLATIKIIKMSMSENAVTKADNKLITDYLLQKCEDR